MSNFLGIPIKTDDSMLAGKVKFVHPDGREQVFDIKTSTEVIDLLTERSDTTTEPSEAQKPEALRGLLEDN